MASTSSITGAQIRMRDKNGLCLLSLDGGGVRGLSALLILKGIMQQVNEKRKIEGLPHVRPCDVFDLIGGTSTGGLIAIMLGRLQMDIQPCIEAYSKLSRKIFNKRALPMDWRGNVKGRYDASQLEEAVKIMVEESGLPEDSASPEKAFLNDRKDRGSRAFVCAVRKETQKVARLRTYQSRTALVQDDATIWEAARATSAASGFFDPITIGRHGQQYVDAALGCNNPVDEVWTEAQDIWSPEGEDLSALVKCFISIGTGNPGISPIEDSVLKVFTKTLKEIATQTEKTAEIFEKGHRGLLIQKRYFRFNVDQGLQAVGLEEYEKERDIVSATSDYMESQRLQWQTDICSNTLKDKEFRKCSTTDKAIRILEEQQTQPKDFQLVFSLIAAPEIDYFVGRAGDLASIKSVLLPFTTPKRKVAVLHGLGGIGKSQLAIEFAKSHRGDYTAVFWLNAKTEDTLKRSFADNARQLPKEYFDQGLLESPQNEDTLGRILRQTKAWLGLPGNDRWLLIYDNVDNPKLPDNRRESAYDIRSYFPEAHQGSILVTTRWRSLRIGRPIEVTKLSEDAESVSLLVQLAGEAIREDPGLQKLVTKLDGLPLALATAGGYLGLTSISVAEYLDHYKNSWLDLQRTSPAPLSYVDQTIYSTWNLSYIYIRKEDQSAAKLLELWAYFDNRDLWYDLLKAGDLNLQKTEDLEIPDWFHDMVGTKLRFKSAVGKLRKHALVEGLTGSDGYSMHHCVHAWVVNVLSKTPEDRSARLAIECICQSRPWKPAPGDWTTRQRLLAHAERCSHRLHAWKDQRNSSVSVERYIVRLHSCLAPLYYDLGKLGDAESMYKRLLADQERILGEDARFTLETVNNLGILFLDQCKLAEAEFMYQRAFDAKTKPLIESRVSFKEDILALVNNLGSLYAGQGKLAKAESMFQLALTGHEDLLGREHISTLQTINNLGLLYSTQGKLTEAEPFYKRALLGYEKVLGKDHLSTLNILHDLGDLYWSQGKLDKAESIYQRVLFGRTKALGKDHLSTPETVNDLGLVYLKQNKLDQAESMFQRALTGLGEALGENHPSTLNTVITLGTLHFKQSNLDKAESMYQRALTGYNRIPEVKPKSLFILFYNMGLLYRVLQDFEKSKELFRQAYEGYQGILGSQHVQTIDALQQLHKDTERATRQAESSDVQK